MKRCCYICKCISKENGCVQNSSLQILTFYRIELLEHTLYPPPLFFLNVKFVLHIYYQSSILILAFWKRKKKHCMKFHAAIYSKTKYSREQRKQYSILC